MKIKAGIIGCGRIAQRFHIKTLTQTSNAELAALCDERIEIPQELAKRYGVQKIFKDYKELISDKEIDMVVLLTPPESHFEIIMDAIKAKKHVFVEKPLANTVEECQKIIESCRDNNVKLMVGFMRRFDKALIWSKEKVKNGEIGKTHVINSSYNLVTTYGEYLKTTDKEIVGKATPSKSYKENMHAFLINNLIHHADLVQWIAGPVKELFASGTLEDDHFSLNAILKFTSGTTGHIQFNGFMRTEWRESLVIHGGKGSLFVDMVFPYLKTPSNGLFVSSENGSKTSPLIILNTMYEDELQYFISCIEKGSEPESNALQALEAQKIVDAVEQSLKLEKWIKIK